MKRWILFFLIGLLVLLGVGCGDQNRQEFGDEYSFIKEYKEKLYTVSLENLDGYAFSNETEAKKYLHEKEFQKMKVNRVFSAIRQTAEQTGRNISLEEIILSFDHHNEQTGIDYHQYIAKIKLVSPDGKLVNTIEKKGQIAVLAKKGEKLKIISDHGGELVPDLVQKEVNGEK